MLEHFFSLMASFRAIIYSAICLSSILVFASYRKAYYKVKRTWIIQSVMHLFFALGFSFFFYTIASLVNLVEGVGLRYRFLVALIGFVNIPLLLAIINFWNASLNQNDQKKRIRRRIYKGVLYSKRDGKKT